MWKQSRLARVFDLLFASAAATFFLPILVGAGVAIAAEDGGPILFRQVRVGMGRRPFEILKLRTMRDGRVTRVGAWLRATGLDEVAQVLNVLRGEMSMVGPRPLTGADVERLGWSLARFDERFAGPPGITGLAQLLGGRSARASRRLERLYARRSSPALDLGLLAWSLVANLVGKREARRLIARVRSGRRARWFERRRAALEAPFQSPVVPVALPAELREPPRLPPPVAGRPVAPRLALLINPFYAKEPHSSFGKHVLTPTLALSSIAAATPPGWRLAYFDENLLQGAPPLEPVPEVVGITVHITFAERAYELASAYRRAGALVVLGGLHVTSCPDEAAPHADAIAIGDGVQTWPRVLQDVADGALQRVYRAGFAGDFGAAPVPRRTILPREDFLTLASVNATRGCTNRCRFCHLATRGVRMPYRTRPPERVANEIRESGERYVVFTDNNLGGDRDYLKALCDALEPLEIIWSSAVCLDVTDDPGLVRAMALSGCTGVFIGFESVVEESLRDTCKRTPRAEDFARRVAIFHQNGIQVNGSFVFGFDGDRRDVFARTVEWIEANRLECATFHILTPYPGTPLFAQLENEDRLLHRRWRLYDTAHAVFAPQHLSPEELEQGHRWAYRRLFSHASIWRRRPAEPLAVLPYLAMSYLYKRSNWIWRLLIRHRLTRRAWRPLVELTRWRHLRFRRRLRRSAAPAPMAGAAATAAR
jgi:lipopolysaccharide/colanic/teichoic acid biosynthesis glycosyltransferase/radical SAM superfamily enzyme YgiQ (UPF0313 family)